MARLKGKRAIVTGGAKGIGRAIAARFVDEGATVLITDIDEVGGAKAANEIGAIFNMQDVSDEASWPLLREVAEARFLGLDVLVNNAGVGEAALGTNPETTKLEDWKKVFSVNAEGVFMGCREMIPLMAQTGGSIINLSSIAALVPTPFVTAYGASKAAVLQLSRSVAFHCAQSGYKIRCNTIHPGQIETPMFADMMKETANAAGVPEEELRAEFLSRIPLGEMGDVDDIANAALFLASDESKHITGTQMVVDGGMQLIN